MIVPGSYLLTMLLLKNAKRHLKQIKRSILHITYKLNAGAEDGDTFGINWDKVKAVSGQTYGIRAELKERGFKWDGKTKKWRKE